MICPMMMKTLLFLPLRLLLLTRMGKAVAARAEAWQQAEGMFARAWSFQKQWRKVEELSHRGVDERLLVWGRKSGNRLV